MRQLVARVDSLGRRFGTAALALIFLGAFASHAAYAEQGERPFFRANKEQREQRQQLREERREMREQIRQQRQEQMRERGDEVRRPLREPGEDMRRPLREPGDEARRPLRERVEADENQDRALNRDEAQKHFPRLGKRFDQIDGNRDGIITRDEVRAFRDARAKARVWAGEGDDPRD